MSDKNKEADKADTVEVPKKEEKVFKGTVRRPFSIQARYQGEGEYRRLVRKAVDYKLGDSFETKNEKFFQSLIDKKRIRA